MGEREAFREHLKANAPREELVEEIERLTEINRGLVRDYNRRVIDQSRLETRAETAAAERDEAREQWKTAWGKIDRLTADNEQLRAERDKLREALAEAGGVLAALLLADQTAEQEDGLRVHAPEVLDAIKQAEAGARAALASTEER